MLLPKISSGLAPMARPSHEHFNQDLTKTHSVGTRTRETLLISNPRGPAMNSPAPRAITLGPGKGATAFIAFSPARSTGNEPRLNKRGVAATPCAPGTAFPGVECRPAALAKRQTAAWRGLSGEVVQIIKQEAFECKRAKALRELDRWEPRTPQRRQREFATAASSGPQQAPVLGARGRVCRRDRRHKFDEARASARRDWPRARL